MKIRHPGIFDLPFTSQLQHQVLWDLSDHLHEISCLVLNCYPTYFSHGSYQCLEFVMLLCHGDLIITTQLFVVQLIDWLTKWPHFIFSDFLFCYFFSLLPLSFCFFSFCPFTESWIKRTMTFFSSDNFKDEFQQTFKKQFPFYT